MIAAVPRLSCLRSRPAMGRVPGLLSPELVLLALPALRGTPVLMVPLVPPVPRASPALLALRVPPVPPALLAPPAPPALRAPPVLPALLAPQAPPALRVPPVPLVLPVPPALLRRLFMHNNNFCLVIGG